MRYYRMGGSSSCTKVIVETGAGAYDLSSASPRIDSLVDLAEEASVSGTDLDTVAERYLPTADKVDRETLESNYLVPLVPNEVWAAGVTYEVSEEARKEESTLPELYRDVYDADRPELFFKATPNRIVGPGETIGIRADSNWDVPEPEMGVALYRGEIIGYTIGNDVSSRQIEGENALYLPQAKVYDRCCSVGPCIATAGSVDDPHDLSMSMEIARDERVVFEDETSTSRMIRQVNELVSYFTRHNAVPDVAIVLTGTSLVPPEEFTLQAGDVVTIDVENIGTLQNTVVTV